MTPFKYNIGFQLLVELYLILINYFLFNCVFYQYVHICFLKGIIVQNLNPIYNNINLYPFSWVLEFKQFSIDRFITHNFKLIEFLFVIYNI